jgi:restriction endonuclease S subunit
MPKPTVVITAHINKIEQRKNGVTAVGIRWGKGDDVAWLNIACFKGCATTLNKGDFAEFTCWYQKNNHGVGEFRTTNAKLIQAGESKAAPEERDDIPY